MESLHVRIVRLWMEDMSWRQLFAEAWQEYGKEIQDEIRDKWEEIVRAELELEGMGQDEDEGVEKQ